MNLSFVYITARYEPRVDWFLDSLFPQLKPGETPQIIIVAPEHSRVDRISGVEICRPKPTVWSGPSRITKADWWSAANARNTGICYAQGDWLAFVDDRSLLLPGWLDSLRLAIEGGYVVCGSYQKVQNLVVEDAKPKTFNANPGRDSRLNSVDPRLDYTNTYWIPHYKHQGPFDCPGEWTYGCSLGLPMEWALKVGGFDETCDGLGGEDYIFGLMLQNNNFPIKFDPRMRIIEDRTPGQSEPTIVRKDKGVSPNDKSHALLAKLRVLKNAILPGNLREIRASVLRGGTFPMPNTPPLDWYDNQPINHME